MDRLLSMAVFVRVVDHGSFSAAARTLGLSAQMVGKHVGALEARLGAQLLRRTTRRQSLTEVGRVFCERCRLILGEAEAAEAIVHDLGAAPRGRLRVSAPVGFGACRLAPLVSRFLDAYPETQVELALTDRFVDVIDEGYDAVLRLGPLPETGLVARALAPHAQAACASPTYLAAHGTPRTPADLSGHVCLGYVNWSGLPYAEWRFTKGRRVHAVRVRSRFRVNDGRALAAAACDGRGIVLQPEAVLREDLEAGRLVRVLPDYEAPARPMYLLYAAARPQTPTLRAFIECVLDAFGRGQGGAHR